MRAKVAAIMLIVVVLSVEILGGLTFSTLLIRVKYLKGELTGSFTSVIKNKLNGEMFSRLQEDGETIQ